jgi:hypothetical protein
MSAVVLEIIDERLIPKHNKMSNSKVSDIGVRKQRIQRYL